MTERQKRFVDEYLIDLNATQAAIRAGYSVKTAGQIGDENLKKPQIERAVKVVLAERSRRTGITADRVLEEMAKIGFANIAEVVNLDEAAVRDGAANADTAAIQSIKVKTTSTEYGDTTEREVRMYDKTRALIELGKHVGLFDNKLKIEGSLPVFFEGESELID